ncbi:hypothetical protein N7460_004345 [Penicillium canescens]|uniref:Uncharacterized protein n=1 Tax=Penicillium canescens TaxID=5083 RepID=A0AAD6NCL3_PENCN|nr:hypothetical protein N7444_012752 [Penicillium canescens]KAJ6048198.1 hypothetical protein N7460_004345 [Penicillium canescens]
MEIAGGDAKCQYQTYITGSRYQATKEDDCCDVADRYPSATVRGVDIFPPPVSWMPPNCVFEVDDVLREWT